MSLLVHKYERGFQLYVPLKTKDEKKGKNKANLSISLAMQRVLC